MNLSDEALAGAVWRKQCGIPLTDEIICPEEAVGDVTVTLEDGSQFDLPICESHFEAVSGIRPGDLTLATE